MVSDMNGWEETVEQQKQFFFKSHGNKVYDLGDGNFSVSQDALDDDDFMRVQMNVSKENLIKLRKYKARQLIFTVDRFGAIAARAIS